MRSFALLLLIMPLTRAQDQTIVLGQSAVPLTGPWQFSPGDSPVVNGQLLWAQPDFDDSRWATMDLTPPAGSLDVMSAAETFVPGWTRLGYPHLVGYAWYRLRVRVASHGQPVWLEMPIDVDDAYQIFGNGRCVGEFGHFGAQGVALHYGQPRNFQLPAPAQEGNIELAIRLYMSPASPWRWPDAGGIHNPPVLGLRSTNEFLYQSQKTEVLHFLFSPFITGLIYLLALPLPLWAWRSHRAERAWLWLFLALTAQVGWCVVRTLAELNSHVSMGFAEFWRFVVTPPAIDLCWILFWWHWFGLRDRAWIRRNAWVLTAANAAVAFVLRSPYFGVHFATEAMLRASNAATIWLSGALCALVLLLLAEGFRRDRTAALLAAAPILLLAFNNFYVPLLVFFRMPSQFFLEGLAINDSDLGAVLMLMIVGALSVRRFLASRDREVVERETIARDLEQARQLQQGVLVAEEVRSAFCAVQVTYRPAQTVGGDFFQTVTRADGSLTVVIGDVSGKGISAAMLVAVLVGAVRARARETGDPAAILEELNAQLMGRAGGHFATCLVATVTADGMLRLANAGHLPPYRNGREMELEGSLPLGIAQTLEPAVQVLQLEAADTLTFVSDGVVEARNGSGELFGFERTRAISREPAEVVAEAARQFGQEDDITVLTLAYAPVEVVSA